MMKVRSQRDQGRAGNPQGTNLSTATPKRGLTAHSFSLGRHIDMGHRGRPSGNPNGHYGAGAQEATMPKGTGGANVESQ
jgi:hypothetical protein